MADNEDEKAKQEKIAAARKRVAQLQKQKQKQKAKKASREEGPVSEVKGVEEKSQDGASQDGVKTKTAEEKQDAAQVAEPAAAAAAPAADDSDQPETTGGDDEGQVTTKTAEGQHKTDGGEDGSGTHAGTAAQQSTSPDMPEEAATPPLALAPLNTRHLRSFAGRQRQGPDPPPASEAAPHLWTTEQDACLMELKRKKCTWNAISRTLNVSRNECRCRWAELRRMEDRERQASPAGEVGASKLFPPGAGARGKETVSEVTDEECRCRRCREAVEVSAGDARSGGRQCDADVKVLAQRVKKQRVSSPSSPAPSPVHCTLHATRAAQPHANTPRPKHQEPEPQPQPHTEPSKFDMQELLMLTQLAEKFEREKWLRVSSRFYDLTGRRITPGEAQQMLAMGLCL
ncbi:hypothetical protein KEM52_006288 [Ascosphaera acerosa]|nr:hypothetical protein KEM52_006288 [Ascosphaera acerosa]